MHQSVVTESMAAKVPITIADLQIRSGSSGYTGSSDLARGKERFAMIWSWGPIKADVIVPDFSIMNRYKLAAIILAAVILVPHISWGQRGGARTKAPAASDSSEVLPVVGQVVVYEPDTSIVLETRSRDGITKHQ